MMLSGGSFFGKKRLAISKSYGTITTHWGGMKFLPLSEKNSLTHVFDPCWNRGGRLPAEEKMSRFWRMARKQGVKNLSKTRSAQPLEK